LELTKSPTAIICLSANNGGMEIDSIKLAKKLRNVCAVTLVAKQNSFIASHQDELQQHNITLETIRFHSNISLSIIINARRIIKQYSIKNVIFFGASELKSLYFAFLGLDINLIVRHGTTKSRPKKDWFHKLIYSNVNYHVAICKHLKRNVEYIIPFGKDTQSKLIYSAVDVQPAKQQEHSRLTLLHVGRITDAKGQVDAIKACRNLVEHAIDFVFYLVGDIEESYKKHFLDFYNTLPYKENIKLVGYTEDVQNHLQTADIFLFPSHGEGLSNAFLEALASSLVCISYNNTSFPELQELGLYFNMVPNKDIEKLSAQLLDTTLHLEEKRKNAEKNLAIIQKQFSTETEMKKYKEILR